MGTRFPTNGYVNRGKRMDHSRKTLLQAVQRLKRSGLREGKPFPLGATWDGLGVNFALFSAHATKVELCLFDDGASVNSSASSFPNIPTKSGTAICQARVPARSMAIACTGPIEPDAGHRFNPNKLLIDPYARQLVGELRLGSRSCSVTDLTIPTRTSHSTTATARR